MFVEMCHDELMLVDGGGLGRALQLIGGAILVVTGVVAIATGYGVLPGLVIAMYGVHVIASSW